MKQLLQLPIYIILFSGLSYSQLSYTTEPDIKLKEDKLTLHASPSERLRTIMQNINLTIHDSTNIDSQSDKFSNQDMEDMIEVIEELLFYAEMMSTDVHHPNLEGNDIVTFRALAGQLYTEALSIQQLARDYHFDTYDYELLNTSYRRLNETCMACHQLFRDK